MISIPKQRIAGIGAAVLLASVAAACGANGGGAGSASSKPSSEERAASKEPVEIVFYSPQAGRTPEQFMRENGNDIKEKFPHVTVKFIQYAKGTETADLLASGQPIDIIISSTSTINELVDYNLQYDITELIKKHKYDLNRLEPSAVQFMKEYAGGGMYGLPTRSNTFLLFYNKNLLDKFGVPYPKEGSTWDDIYELAKKMTRVDSGTQYFGLTTSYSHMITNNQLSVPSYDTKTDKVMLEDDKFKAVVNNFARFYQIAGTQFVNDLLTKHADLFKKDQTAAMYAYYGSDMIGYPATFDWDVIPMPYFKEAAGVAPQQSPAFFSITGMSKHKDQAFEIIAYLTSDEFQMKQSMEGTLPTVTIQTVQSAYAQNQQMYKGKNIKAYFSEKTAPISNKDKLNSIAAGKANTAFKEIVTGSKDLNTALRDAAEAARADINAEKSKK
ncbi:ABC transporter substrate-binding protein [Paenibacillus oceani]|uniref:Extracellular solute-binding protein n=1 Tax=Paenibacillus oceani TaxID=2772510 RepID=A0A927CCF6_9BACL|nr:extracellular solute-binding protein [Paenibacillus oceani]MBD2865080.1 extracellular solute-binding protein [Paenibacillus oceani]